MHISANIPHGIPAPTLDLDIYSEQALADPESVNKPIRQAGPVVYLPRYDVYAMARHKDVTAAMKDWETFSNTGGFGLDDIRTSGVRRPGKVLLEVDPPDHTRMRVVYQRILSPAVLRQWREVFERDAETLVASVVDKGSFDGVHDLSDAYISTTFPNALGLEWTPERRQNLWLIGDANFNAQGPENELRVASQKRTADIADWHNHSMTREAMVPGGFGASVFNAADTGQIEADEAPMIIASFLRGGLDSTIGTISAAIYYLARDPKQFALLREDPSRARGVIEEAMRLETPIQKAGRLTTRTVDVDGTLIEPDRKVLMLLASANRDPARWENPDQFDLQRQTLGHLALGVGTHVCVGQMLARLEGETLLRALTARVSELALDGEVTRRINNNLYSLESIPLRVKPA